MKTMRNLTKRRKSAKKTYQS